MWEHNDGAGEDNALQNQFTTYVVTALDRRKRRYLSGKNRRMGREELFDPLECTPEAPICPDPLDELPVLEQLEDVRLQCLLAQYGERALYILFSRILDDRPFLEIAADLSMTYTAVSKVYYRMIARLKKGLGRDEQ